MKSSLLLLAALAMTGSSVAQTVVASKPAYVGELVMDASGRVMAPWKTTKSCTTDAASAQSCRVVIINPTTREIAQLGGQWSSKFAPTGTGSEVRRLESTVNTARRLASQKVE